MEEMLSDLEYDGGDDDGDAELLLSSILGH